MSCSGVSVDLNISGVNSRSYFHHRDTETAERHREIDRGHEPTASIYHFLFTIYYSFMNSDPAIRVTMLPRDTNSQGTIFGGVILSYIDMAGAIAAHRTTAMDRFVTVAMREIIFHAPVFIGDLVSFYSETIKIGTTSITTRVVVESERYGGPSKRVRVTEAEVIYVAVDKEGRKTKITAK